MTTTMTTTSIKSQTQAWRAYRAPYKLLSKLRLPRANKGGHRGPSYCSVESLISFHGCCRGVPNKEPRNPCNFLGGLLTVAHTGVSQKDPCTILCRPPLFQQARMKAPKLNPPCKIRPADSAAIMIRNLWERSRN